MTDASVGEEGGGVFPNYLNPYLCKAWRKARKIRIDQAGERDWVLEQQL